MRNHFIIISLALAALFTSCDNGDDLTDIFLSHPWKLALFNEGGRRTPGNDTYVMQFYDATFSVSTRSDAVITGYWTADNKQRAFSCSRVRVENGSIEGDTIAQKMELVRSCRPFAVAMDIDAAGLPFLKNQNPPAGSKSVEELRQIIDRVDAGLRGNVGVCFDTCHVSDAGYDIIGDLDGVLREFDRIVGIDRIRAVHLNDSMNPPASRKDRHAKIGEGHIGLEAITKILNHPYLRDLPFYLETPNELEGYGNEIRLLRGVYTENEQK
jgi:hypothetical protein